MNITDYISNEIKPLELDFKVEKAKELFDNYPITHFPLVDNSKLLGSFAEEDIRSLDNKTATISNFTNLLDSFFAHEKTSTLKLLKIFSDNNTSVIPVLNSEKNYIGYYDISDVLDIFTSSPFMQENSEILVIEKHEKDYSMSQISQIIESNNSTLQGLYISEKKEDTVQITLKIITEDINEVMHTFRRYDYAIVSSHENDIYLEDLKNRSEYLQKYLEM